MPVAAPPHTHLQRGSRPGSDPLPPPSVGLSLLYRPQPLHPFVTGVPGSQCLWEQHPRCRARCRAAGLRGDAGGAASGKVMGTVSRGGGPSLAEPGSCLGGHCARAWSWAGTGECHALARPGSLCLVWDSPCCSPVLEGPSIPSPCSAPRRLLGPITRSERNLVLLSEHAESLELPATLETHVPGLGREAGAM